MTVSAREAASPPDPVIISWSGLKRWENCPQHQLRTIRNEVEKSNKGRIFLPGTVTDLVQRRWLDQDNPEPGQMPEMVEEVFNEVVDLAESKIQWRGDPRDDIANVKSDVRRAVRKLEPWLLENVVPFDYQPEFRFKAHMQVPYICGDGVQGPVTMIGGIDILVRDHDQKYRIIDLKMTKDPGYIRSTLGQLTFYDIAWGVISGDFHQTVTWEFLCPMMDEFTIPVTVEREDRQAMLSRIVKYAQGVWSNNWAPKSDDTGCTWCEARGTCEKFKTVATVEENGKMLVSFSQAAAQRAKFR